LLLQSRDAVQLGKAQNFFPHRLSRCSSGFTHTNTGRNVASSAARADFTVHHNRLSGENLASPSLVGPTTTYFERKDAQTSPLKFRR